MTMTTKMTRNVNNDKNDKTDKSDENEENDEKSYFRPSVVSELEVKKLGKKTKFHLPLKTTDGRTNTRKTIDS